MRLVARIRRKSSIPDAPGGRPSNLAETSLTMGFVKLKPNFAYFQKGQKGPPPALLAHKTRSAELPDLTGSS